MANGFQGPPAVDFYSQLSGLGDVIAANRAAQAKRDAFAQATTPGPDGQIDYGKAILGLAQVDPQAAAVLAAQRNHADTLKQQAIDNARNSSRDATTDRHWSADYGLRKAANERSGEDKFNVLKVEDPNTGATSFVKANPRTGEVVPTGPQVAPSTPNNPFSTGGKFNGDQGKAAGFTDRMLQSEGILSGVGPTPGAEGPPMPGVQGQGADITQTAMTKIPGVGNFMVSEPRQKYNQAKADFINAQLRRESGAAIAKSEFDNADKQYFPVPGDSPAVIQQKAGNRRAAIEAMGREGGGSYKPKLSFDESGGVVPYGAPSRAAPPPDGLSGASVVASSAPQDPRFPPPPKLGELRGGYRFKGGNPGEPSNWSKASN